MLRWIPFTILLIPLPQAAASPLPGPALAAGAALQRGGPGPARGQRATRPEPETAREQQAARRTDRRQARRVVDPQSVVAGEEQILGWFNTGDWDQNGWISFREAKKSLSFDRERYGAYDDDDDGRLTLREFREYYFYNFRNVGGFIPPRPRPTEALPPRRSPEQLRNAYDRNLDGKLSLRELKRLLDDYGGESKPATDQVLRALDANRNQLLELEELRGVRAVLKPHALEPEVPTTEQTIEVTASTVDELFGQRIPRGTSPGATPYPPLIPGPLPHYRRLDYDDDGRVTATDLESLLRPVQIPVRIQTVFNTIDLNGDGNLDRSEFRRALSDLE